MANKVFIVVPAFGGRIEATTFMTISGLQAQLYAKNIGAAITTFSFPDIAELRSIFTTLWYDTMPDTDMLLWVDADMGFDPQLVLDMILFNEPLVGCIYRQRNPNWSWAGSGNGQNMTERRGGFIEVEGTGFGCTLMRREVVTKMLEKFPELSDERIVLHPAFKMLQGSGCKRLIRCFEKLDIKDRGVVSEDLSFCIRWRECGGKVWANVSHQISHVGPYDYRGSYLEYIQQQTEQQASQASFVTGPIQ